MSKNVFVEAGSFRRLLLGAAGGYELQGYHEAAQTVMHVIDALDELTTGGKGRSQEDEDREAAEAAETLKLWGRLPASGTSASRTFSRAIF